MAVTREFGEMVRTGRRRLPLSESELSEELGVHRNTISRWELGATLPEPPMVRRLAEHLKIKPARLAEARLRDLISRNGERLMVGGLFVALGAHALVTWHVFEPVARSLGLS